MLKGTQHSLESLKKISEHRKGKYIGKRPEYIGKKISVAKKGNVVISEEQRRKISESNKGRQHTEEHKRKIGESLKGHQHSEETRRKISESLKGHLMSKETRRKKSVVRKGKYCGEQNPFWKGGTSFEPYCPKFNREFKERVRAFFNYTCQNCDHIWRANEKRLCVHHINYDKMVCCNDIKPLFVPLCTSCHSKTQSNRDRWEEIFTNKITMEYNGKCYLTKEEMEAKND